MIMLMDPNQSPDQNKQPNQPNQGQYNPNNPYDFITDTSVTKKPLFDHTSTKNRVILIVGGIFLLFIAMGVISSILSSGKKTYISNLKSIYAEQQEVIRISDMGAKDALSPTTRNYAETVSLSVKTQQQQISELISKNKSKVEPAEANIKKSSKTDEALTAAQAANRFDDAITEAINKQLDSYKLSLDVAHASAESQSTKQKLEKMYSETLVIIGKPVES